MKEITLIIHKLPVVGIMFRSEYSAIRYKEAEIACFTGQSNLVYFLFAQFKFLK